MHTGKTAASAALPQPAIGRLKFFDYRKNLFGIITDISSAYIPLAPILTNREEDDSAAAIIKKENIATDKILKDGGFVFFLLNEYSKGFFAAKAKNLYEITASEFESVLPLIKYEHIEFIHQYAEEPYKVTNHSGSILGRLNLDRRSSKHIFENYQKQIIGLLICEKNPKSWDLICSICSKDIISETIAGATETIDINMAFEWIKSGFNLPLIKYLISHADRLAVSQIIKLLKLDADRTLIDLLIFRIEELNSWELIELIQTVSKNNLPAEVFPAGLNRRIEVSGMGQDLLLKIYKCCPSLVDLHHLIKVIDFFEPGSDDVLKTICESLVLSDAERSSIKDSFKQQVIGRGIINKTGKSAQDPIKDATLNMTIRILNLNKSDPFEIKNILRKIDLLSEYKIIIGIDELFEFILHANLGDKDKCYAVLTHSSANDCFSEAIWKDILKHEWSFSELRSLIFYHSNYQLVQKFISNYEIEQTWMFTEDLEKLESFDNLDETSVEPLRLKFYNKFDKFENHSIIKILENAKNIHLIDNIDYLLTRPGWKIEDLKLVEIIIQKFNDSLNWDLLASAIKKHILKVDAKEIIGFISRNTDNHKAIDLLVSRYWGGLMLYYTEEDALRYHNAFQETSKVFDYLENEAADPDLADKFLENCSQSVRNNFKERLTGLSLKIGNKKSLDLLYSRGFGSQEDLLYYIKTIQDNPEKANLLSADGRLTPLIDFITGISGYQTNDGFNNFIREDASAVQPVLMRFIIFSCNNGQISRESLTDLINSVKWTDISSLLIKAFLNASEHNEVILINELNRVFINHFTIEKSENISRHALMEIFSINQLVKRCDGRKHYDAEYWQKNGLSRWYTGGKPSFTAKETMDCFCEGRPWKKERFWNSGSNRQTQEEYDFYWCRTSYCAKLSDKVDLKLPFNKWTLLEIAEVLGIKIEKSVYAVLGGWANRINEILPLLYCRLCSEVLRPVAYTPSSLGFYAVPLFHCINEKCIENMKPVRFTHCINGKCHKTLDSRDCTRCCPTGLICPYCGAVCPSCSGSTKRIMLENTW